jgi:fatty acid desaturase
VRAAAVPAVGALAHPRDAWLLAAGAVHVAAIVLVPSPVVVGVLFWWTANTVAHNFIHNPFFRSRRANAAFSVVLTLLLGVPQALWRARHLSRRVS